MQEPVFQAGGQEAETVNETQAGGDQTDPSLYLKGWVLLTSRPSQADNPVLHKKPEISISVRAQILSWCRGVLKGLHAEGQWQAVWTLPVRALVGSDLHSVEAWPRVAGRLQGQSDHQVGWDHPQRLQPGLRAERRHHGWLLP